MKTGPHLYDLDPNEAKRRLSEDSIQNTIHKLETDLNYLRKEVKSEIEKIYSILNKLQKM
jgi:hypothetical protein